jgi:pyrimidine operon attenuation protein/uracil phosphoribosyltransferase
MTFQFAGGGARTEPLSARQRNVLECQPMRVVEKTQLMSATEIDRTLQRVAHEIVERSGGTAHLALIGVRRRGVPLAQRIALAMRAIDGVDVPVGTLDITLYRDDLSMVAAQPVLQSSEIQFSVDGKDLILVDDVLYTGRTIRAAMNGLFDLGRPRRVRLCVLIDRGHRELPIEAAFIGRTVQTSDMEIIEVRLNEIDQEERVMLVERVP